MLTMIASELDARGHHDLADRMDRLAMRPVRPQDFAGTPMPGVRSIGRDRGITILDVTPELMSELTDRPDPMAALSADPNRMPTTRHDLPPTSRSKANEVGGFSVPPAGVRVRPRSGTPIDSPESVPQLSQLYRNLEMDEADPLVAYVGSPWVMTHELGHSRTMTPSSLDNLRREVDERTMRRIVEIGFRATGMDRQETMRMVSPVVQSISLTQPEEVIANIQMIRRFILAKGVRPPIAFAPNVRDPMERAVRWIIAYMPLQRHRDAPDVWIRPYLTNMLRLDRTSLENMSQRAEESMAWDISNDILDALQSHIRHPATRQMISLIPRKKPDLYGTDRIPAGEGYRNLSQWLHEPSPSQPTERSDPDEPKRPKKPKKPTSKPGKSRRRF